jgi:outer membrane biosynthesis protein TonB
MPVRRAFVLAIAMLFGASGAGCAVALAQGKGDRLAVSEVNLGAKSDAQEIEAAAPLPPQAPEAQPARKPQAAPEAKRKLTATRPAKKPPTADKAAEKPAVEPATGKIVSRQEPFEKPGSEDGLVLEQFTSPTPPKRVGEGNARLLLGEVGRTEYGSFGNNRDPRFVTDPLAQPDPLPPIGFKLKMAF